MKSLILFLFFLTLRCPGATFDDFFHAIWQIESGGRVGRIVGDGGRSLGPLQISRFCWTDAINYGKFGGKYGDVVDPEYAKKVLYFYCKRYERNALNGEDWEILASLWNGGPNWRSKRGRIESNYLVKFRKQIDRL